MATATQVVGLVTQVRGGGVSNSAGVEEGCVGIVTATGETFASMAGDFGNAGVTNVGDSGWRFWQKCDAETAGPLVSGPVWTPDIE